MNLEPSTAADALAAMRDSRARLPSACPPQRHALFAAAFSAAVAAQAAPGLWLFVAMLAILLAVLAIARADRAKTGVFVNGWRRGRTRRVTLGVLGVYLVIDLVVIWLKAEHGLWWAPLVGAAVLFPIAYFASRRWSEVYREELEAAV